MIVRNSRRTEARRFCNVNLTLSSQLSLLLTVIFPSLIILLFSLSLTISSRSSLL
uniref:Uncharacterized protein n=1 Tax=Schistosoma curassoni TaxID=6186 RepID=A0A183KB01_9TREM